MRTQSAVAGAVSAAIAVVFGLVGIVTALEPAQIDDAPRWVAIVSILLGAGSLLVVGSDRIRDRVRPRGSRAFGVLSVVGSAVMIVVVAVGWCSHDQRTLLRFFDEYGSVVLCCAAGVAAGVAMSLLAPRRVELRRGQPSRSDIAVGAVVALIWVGAVTPLAIGYSNPWHVETVEELAAQEPSPTSFQRVVSRAPIEGNAPRVLRVPGGYAVADSARVAAFDARTGALAWSFDYRQISGGATAELRAADAEGSTADVILPRVVLTFESATGRLLSRGMVADDQELSGTMSVIGSRALTYQVQSVGDRAWRVVIRDANGRRIDEFTVPTRRGRDDRPSLVQGAGDTVVVSTRWRTDALYIRDLVAQRTQRISLAESGIQVPTQHSATPVVAPVGSRLAVIGSGRLNVVDPTNGSVEEASVGCRGDGRPVELWAVDGATLVLCTTMRGADTAEFDSELVLVR